MVNGNDPSGGESRKSMKPKLLTLRTAFSVLGLAASIGGSTAAAPKPASTTPCLAVLDRFTAPSVPAMGPDETVSPVGSWTNGITPANLPGKGLAQHSMLYVGENYDKMYLINKGKVIWTYSTGTSYEYDDVWMLSNGNILFR